MTTEDRHVHWRTIIDNQAASGMNIATYCRESHIHPSLFYTWRRKLREQQPCAGGFLELIPGRLIEAAASGIHIRLGEKLAIETVTAAWSSFSTGTFPLDNLSVVESMVSLYGITTVRSGCKNRIKLEHPCRPRKNRSGIMSEKTIQYWIDISEYDLQVAKSLLDKDHYLYVGFMCHQAVEKMLKAMYVKQTSTMPPYIHKLDRLVDLVGLKMAMSGERNDFIDELTPLNIQARYPAYRIK